MSENEQNTWFKQHADTIAVIATIISTVVWMNGKFNEVERDISGLKTDIAVVKTVLVMKNIMPAELTCKTDEEKK